MSAIHSPGCDSPPPQRCRPGRQPISEAKCRVDARVCACRWPLGDAAAPCKGVDSPAAAGQACKAPARHRRAAERSSESWLGRVWQPLGLGDARPRGVARGGTRAWGPRSPPVARACLRRSILTLVCVGPKQAELRLDGGLGAETSSGLAGEWGVGCSGELCGRCRANVEVCEWSDRRTGQLQGVSAGASQDRSGGLEGQAHGPPRDLTGDKKAFLQAAATCRHHNPNFRLASGPPAQQGVLFALFLQPRAAPRGLEVIQGRPSKLAVLEPVLRTFRPAPRGGAILRCAKIGPLSPYRTLLIRSGRIDSAVWCCELQGGAEAGRARDTCSVAGPERTRGPGGNMSPATVAERPRAAGRLFAAQKAPSPL